MKPPTAVKLTKISGTDRPDMPIGYWVSGLPDSVPTVGESFVIFPLFATSLKEEENGITWFHTSTVQSIDGDKLTTLNSEWQIENIQQGG